MVAHGDPVGRVANLDDQVQGIDGVGCQHQCRRLDPIGQHDGVDAGPKAAVVDHILTAAQREAIDIGAVAAVQRVVADATVQVVGAGEAVDGVVAIGAVGVQDAQLNVLDRPCGPIGEDHALDTATARAAELAGDGDRVATGAHGQDQVGAVGRVAGDRDVGRREPRAEHEAVRAAAAAVADDVVTAARIDLVDIAAPGTVHQVVAGTAGQAVDTAETGQLVVPGRCGGIEDPLADVGFAPTGAVGELDALDAQFAAGKLVDDGDLIARPAVGDDHVGGIGAGPGQGDGPGRDRVVEPDGVETVALEPAEDGVAVVDDVGAVAEAEDIDVVTGAAVQLISTGPAFKDVAGVVEAHDLIVAGGGRRVDDAGLDVRLVPPGAILETDRLGAPVDALEAVLHKDAVAAALEGDDQIVGVGAAAFENDVLGADAAGQQQFGVVGEVRDFVLAVAGREDIDISVGQHVVALAAINGKLAVAQGHGGGRLVGGGGGQDRGQDLIGAPGGAAVEGDLVQAASTQEVDDGHPVVAVGRKLDDQIAADEGQRDIARGDARPEGQRVLVTRGLVDAGVNELQTIAGVVDVSVAAGAADQHVRADVAGQHIIARLAEQLVRSIAAAQVVVALAAAQQVSARAAVQRIDAAAAEQLVAAQPAIERVIVVAAEQSVIAVAAVQRVVARLAEQDVDAVAAVQLIVSRVGDDAVVARRPVQHLAGGRSGHLIDAARLHGGDIEHRAIGQHRAVGELEALDQAAPLAEFLDRDLIAGGADGDHQVFEAGAGAGEADVADLDARAEPDCVGVGAAIDAEQRAVVEDGVLAVAGVEQIDVVAFTAFKGVVARAAFQYVVAVDGAPHRRVDDHVIARAADQNVVAGETLDDVVAAGLRRAQQHLLHLGAGPDRAVGELDQLHAVPQRGELVGQHHPVATGADGQHQGVGARRAR